MSRPSILLVEDDPDLRSRIADFLQRHDIATESEGSGALAAARIVTEQPDAVVLDLMLPGKDGLTICREVRGAYGGPILMLTARGGETDEIVGLESGADDYLAKPVRPLVLLARVRALLRRPARRRDGEGSRLRLGELAVDPAARTARLRGEDLALTSGEFDLLHLLVSHAGQVVSRRRMYQELRGTEQDELDRAVDLMVSRLRHKLRSFSGQADRIKSVRGKGYLYAME
ncbi:MAG: response regulator [Byssovorax sp.]